jgi:hypothetical protein
MAAIEAIRDKSPTGSSFDRFRGMTIEPGQSAPLGPDDVFDFLLRRRILTAGLKIACPSCNLDVWLSVNALQTETRCPLCDSVFTLGPQLRRGGEWKYRASGLFAERGKQTGAIPVILALLQLSAEQRFGRRLLYAAGMDLKSGDRECESDLVVLHLDRSGWPTLVLGECKTGGEGIDERDIRNLTAIRDKIVDRGVGCVLLFAKTAAFTDEELQLLRREAQSYVPFVLFSETELEEMRTFSSPKDGVTGVFPSPHHDYGPSEMAADTYARYFAIQTLDVRAQSST